MPVATRPTPTPNVHRWTRALRTRPPVGIPCPTPRKRPIPDHPHTGPAPSSPEWPLRRARHPRAVRRRNVARALSRTTYVRSVPTRRARTTPRQASHPTVRAQRGDPPAQRVGRRRSVMGRHRPAPSRRSRGPSNNRGRRSRPGRRPVSSCPARRSRLASPAGRSPGDNVRRPPRRRGSNDRSIRRSRSGLPTTRRAATRPDRTTGRRLTNGPTIPRLAVGARISIRSIRIGIRRLTDPVARAYRAPPNPLARPDGSSLHWLTR